MKPGIINVPFEELPVSERKFLELWAKKANITIEVLMGHLLVEGALRHWTTFTISFEDKVELDRVMKLRPKMEYVSLTWIESISDWFKKKCRTFIRYLRPRKRK